MILKRLPLVLLMAGLTLAAYFILAAFADIADVRQAAASIGSQAIVVVFLLSAVNYSLRYLRWRILLRALDHDVPEVRNIAYYLAGFAFTATPGKAGEAVRSLYLLPHGVPVAESIGVLVFDRVFDLIAIGLLTLFLFIRWELATAIAIGGCLVGGLAGHPAVRHTIGRIFARTVAAFPGWMRGKLSRLSSLRHVTQTLAQPKLLILGTTLGLLAWLAEGLGLYVLVVAMDPGSDLFLAVGIYGLSILVGVASFLPGGLGSTEAAMGLLLSRNGLPPDMAVAATILCRVATLWFAVALGVLAALCLVAIGRPAMRAPTS